MLVEVSVGEVIDKYNILEIKKRRVIDEKKLEDINKELNALKGCEDIINSTKFFYKLLTWVNESIWDKTDLIKQMDYNNENFAKVSYEIFELNQKRFRIKNIYNLLQNSNLKEQKSYASSHIIIHIENEDTFFEKLSEINYLMLEYDTVSFDCNFMSTVKNIYNVFPNIIYENIPPNYQTKYINTYSIEENLKEIFEFEPINYSASGLLGDFIHQLSIVYERFRNTGRKGIIYLTNEHWRFSLEKTKHDLDLILKQQVYIKYISIEDISNKKIDSKLSAWRGSPLLCIPLNWYDLFKNIYQVEWGCHKWLKLPVLDNWKDKTVLCSSDIRFPKFNFKDFYEKYKTNLIFVCQSYKEYEAFSKKANMAIDYYIANDFYEYCCIINSCNLYIGNLTGGTAIAWAFYKKCIIMLEEGNTDNMFIRHIEEKFPHFKFIQRIK